MGKRDLALISLVLIITALVFSGTLELDWTNWDDDLFVYENRLVREGTPKEIFTESAKYNTYNPLVISFFSLEWKLVKDKPFLYHLNNYILHLLCTLLVWFLSRRLGLSVWWSCFVSMLFGIHPMRVESVAWITERKDLLYAVFYLAALLTYIRYIASEKKGLFLLTLLFFVLSLFAKIQAELFPFALMLLDWYYQRRIGKKVIIEKTVFFVISIIHFLICYFVFIKDSYVSAKIESMDLLHQLILGGYAYGVYVLKSLIPYVTSVLYPVPAFLEAAHWIGALLAIVIFLGALSLWRQKRFVTFGFLFFTLNIFPLLLAFKAGESAFLNDRYTYIAYIGLFFVIAMSLQQLSEKYPSFKLAIMSMIIILISIFSMLTVKYIPVWKNSETLWTHVIEKYPHQIPISYLKRGVHFSDHQQTERALDDFNTVIEMDPSNIHAYMSKGYLYLTNNDLENALQNYSLVLDLLSTYAEEKRILNAAASEILGNRGIVYFKMAQYEKALSDLNSAIAIDPQNIVHYLNRAFVYIDMGEYEKSIGDLTFYLQSDPANSDVVNNRGVCYMRLGHYESALADFSRAILIKGSNASYYTNRAWVYRKVGLDEKAQKDLQIAEKLAQ